MTSIRWIPVSQEVPHPELGDPAATLRDLLGDHPGLRAVASGSRVAVAVGSRGIPGVGPLVAEVVRAVRQRGARPFVVPAMGSHGGAGAREQEAVLSHLGVTEATVGAPVVSRAEVLRLGEAAPGLPVWVDAEAWGADAVIPVNRVKPHTAFRGRVESGPSKLLAVGLGKARSAKAAHAYGEGLAAAIPALASHLLASGRIPLGVAVVENAFGALACVEILTPPEWLAAEARLLDFAWDLYPRMPWSELDLLVVERIGKDLSGTGMDLNVIGLERRFPGCGALPRIRRVVALSLTDASLGNATGMGYADVVTRALAEKVDSAVTLANCETTGFLEAARLPTVAADDEEALEVALSTLSPPLASLDAVRAVRILDTAHLTEFLVSSALSADLPPGVHRSCG